MEMVTHPDTTLMVATLTKTAPRRWMLMLWDGQGEYRKTDWYKTKNDALQALYLHCRQLRITGEEIFSQWRRWPRP
ncbi:MAG: hypothetical protein ACK40S_01360 [Burkholderiaceae bacterium]